MARLDYEPELVFVLGRAAFGVTEDEAMDYVAGITILNDLTCRDTQKREVASGSRFWTAKNAPGFGPLGPYIITMDEVPDPYDIWVTCSVNGEQRMRVNTNDQIWKLPKILAHFSRLVPLQPGDMFSTGALTLSPQGDATRVSWTNEGNMDNNPMMRWFAPFMDRMMGPDFEGGLANLKALAEKP